MPNKTQEYLNLAQQTAKELTRYWENWTDYLTTASRLYKYSYADQLMIYAQRPDATACASFDLWNNRMNRYVRRGSKGIALLDQSSSVPRLHYVFDVSDTGVRRNSRDPEVWQFNDDLKQPVSEMLAATYGISGERVSQQLADVAGKLVADYWDNNGGDIRAIVDGSLLMDYDEAGVEMQFKSAAAISVTYTLLERCGFEPAGWFDKDDFRAIHDFSTPDSVYALGAAVSDMSREVLRNIERTVKTTIRRRNAERSQYEYEQQERDLLDRRGLPAPEPDPEPAPEAAGQIRQAAPDVPERPSPGAVQHDAPEREPVPAPDGGGADGREPDAADHAGTAEAEPGSEQGAESDGVGAAHEQSESTGRGTGAERTDLQLSFFDAHIPTEAKQIESIDQAESEKSPSAFVLSQAEIENALRRGSNFENSKLRIWKIYQLQPDRKLRAKALANEYAPYGPGGSSHTYLDGSSGWLDHDSKGLTFEHYPDHQKVLLRWDRVEKYIDLMIQSDRYLSDKERRAIDFPLELNAASAAEYTALKAQHPDTLVGFEAGGNFMFYGEDAAKVAKIINSALFTRDTALGEVQVTGFSPRLWARKSKELWSAGNDVYLAGLNEDGTHHQTKENDPELKNSRWIAAVVLLFEGFTVWMLLTGVQKIVFYYDGRFAIPAKLMFWGNILFPAITLLWSGFWLIRKRKTGVSTLLPGLLVCTVLNTVMAASVPALTSRYYLALGAGAINQYLLFLLIDLLFFICCVIYLSSSFIVAWKAKAPEHRYKGENLFFFGQITSKLNTTSKTMTLICVTLVLAIFMFIAAPILVGWASGYLDIRSMYDVQISSRYNDVYDEENLPDDNYELVTDFLSEHGIETDYDCTFSLYLPSKDDFHNRMKYDFPVVAISLSDYNTIRKMLGYEPITLSEDEFTTQWQSIATNEERDSFLKEHSSILTDAGELTLSEHSFYEEAIGETAYNSYTDVLYVFPDSICENLLSVIRNRYIMTTESISYENARTLEQAFSAEYPEITDTGVSYAIRLSALQVNTTKASNFVLQASMLYAAVVLMVICLTVLSLQQLLDASQYKYRFSVLRKLGVEDAHIGKLVLKQLGIWFGLPIVVAIIVSTMVIIYFIQTISAEISAYIGFGALMSQIGTTVSILALLLICYFISTWLLFKKSIK